MEFKFISRKGAFEIVPIGKLDIEQSESFEKNLNDKVKETEEKALGINLQKIEYIDSSGLGTLIKVLNNAKNSGKTLYLYGATPKIQNIFQIARLEKFFTFITQAEFKSKFPSAEDQEGSGLTESE